MADEAPKKLGLSGLKQRHGFWHSQDAVAFVLAAWPLGRDSNPATAFIIVLRRLKDGKKTTSCPAKCGNWVAQRNTSRDNRTGGPSGQTTTWRLYRAGRARAVSRA